MELIPEAGSPKLNCISKLIRSLPLKNSTSPRCVWTAWLSTGLPIFWSNILTQIGPNFAINSWCVLMARNFVTLMKLWVHSSNRAPLKNILRNLKPFLPSFQTNRWNKPLECSLRDYKRRFATGYEPSTVFRVIMPWIFPDTSLSPPMVSRWWPPNPVFRLHGVLRPHPHRWALEPSQSRIHLNPFHSIKHFLLLDHPVQKGLFPHPLTGPSLYPNPIGKNGVVWDYALAMGRNTLLNTNALQDNYASCFLLMMTRWLKTVKCALLT